MSKPSTFFEWCVLIIRLLLAILPYAKDLFTAISDAIDDFNELSETQKAKVLKVAQ